MNWHVFSRLVSCSMLQVLQLDFLLGIQNIVFLGAGKRPVALLFQVCAACRFESMRSRPVGREGHGSG